MLGANRWYVARAVLCRVHSADCVSLANAIAYMRWPFLVDSVGSVPPDLARVHDVNHVDLDAASEWD